MFRYGLCPLLPDSWHLFDKIVLRKDIPYKNVVGKWLRSIGFERLFFYCLARRPYVYAQDENSLFDGPDDGK